MRRILSFLLFSLALTSPLFAQDNTPNAQTLYQQGEAAMRERKPQVARKLFQQAADLGNRNAQYRYALLLFNGEGGPRDHVKAREYNRRAAEAGDTRSMLNYGNMLLRAQGGDRDRQGGLEWMEKAAKRDNWAALRLADTYEHGLADVPRDLAKAIEWYDKATALRNLSAKVHADRLRQAAASTPAQKLATYREKLAAADQAEEPSKARGAALAAYLRETYDSGLSPQAAAQAIKPAVQELIEKDFYAVHRAGWSTHYTLLPAFHQLLTPDQREINKRLTDKGHNRPNTPDPGIKPGQGWRTAFPSGTIPKNQPVAATTPATQPAKPRLASAIANAKNWDDLFAAVAAEKYRWQAEGYAKAFAAHFPSPPEEIRDAYRRALTRHKPLAEDKRGSFAGKLFLSYHQALLARGLSPQDAANFSREDFQRLAQADIYNAYEGIPTSAPHLNIFRGFLSQAQNNQIKQISQGLLAARQSGGTSTAATNQTTPSGLQEFQSYPNNFRRNLPGHWRLSAKMFQSNPQEMDVKFAGASGASTTMTATPFGNSPSNYTASIVENKNASTGGVWFKLIIRYNSMRLEGSPRSGGGITGEIYNTKNQQIGTWSMHKRLDLDYLALAQRASRAKDHQAALHYYSGAIRHRPQASYLIARASIHHNLKDSEAALKDLNEALKREPQNDTALFGRMLVHYYDKKYPEALADVDKVIAKKNSSLPASRIAETHFFRGDTLWWLERHDDAEKAYADAIKLDPKLAERTRAANTREAFFASMNKSLAETNRIMNKLNEGVAKSTEELRKANEVMQKVNADAKKVAGEIAAQTADPSSPVDLVKQLYSTLTQSLNKSGEGKSAHFTADQTAALEQVTRLLPQAKQHHAQARQKQLQKFESESPGAEAFATANKAFSEKNLPEAKRHWEQAASQGHPRSMFNLARFVFIEGIPDVLEPDLERAKEWLLKSAEAGQVEACVELAAIHGGRHKSPRNHIEGRKWAAKGWELGDPYSGYLLYYHTHQQRLQEMRSHVIRMPNSPEAKAVDVENKAALAAVTDAALLGEANAMRELGKFHYYGNFPGMRTGFTFSRGSLDLHLARFWLQQALDLAQSVNEKITEETQQTIATIDQALALRKGREWKAAEIQAALEAGLPQQAIAYLIDREKARLTKREQNRLVATEAWKKVPEYSTLSMTLAMHTLIGADQEAREIAKAAIAERQKTVLANPAPDDTPELRARYAAGDPAAAYALYQVLNHKYPHGWPKDAPNLKEVRERAVAQDYAPAQHLRIHAEGLEYNSDKTKIDHARMIRLLRTSAEAGDATAARELADAFAATGNERGVRRNFREAEYWYIQAGALAWPEQFKNSLGFSPENLLAQIYSLDTPSGPMGGMSLSARHEATHRWVRELRQRGGILKELADDKAAYYATKDAGNTQIEPLIAKLPLEAPAFIPEELQQLEQKAAANDSAALVTLAQAYAYGERGLRQSDDLAVELYQKAAAQGNKDAMLALAEHYEKGYGINKNPLLGVEWKLRGEGKTAKPGEIAFRAGEIARQDSDLIHLAAGYYRQAAEAGHPEGMRWLAYALREKKYGEPNPEESLRWLTKAAEAGDRLAMSSLAHCYDKGEHGASQDSSKAFFWFEKAAETGDRLYMGLVARAYENGERGATKDLQKALYWHRKAFAAGDSFSKYRIEKLEKELNLTSAPAPEELMKQAGELAQTNPAEAVKRIQQAAEAKYPPAQYQLGVLHAQGNGVPQDHARALQLVTAAADAGFIPAQFDLGRNLLVGNPNIPANPARGLAYLKKVAEQTQHKQAAAQAAGALGEIYERGVGVPANPTEALRWYEKARNLGLPQAAPAIQRVQGAQRRDRH